MTDIVVGAYVTLRFATSEGPSLVLEINTRSTPPNIKIRRPNGIEEWVPLNAIAGITSTPSDDYNHDDSPSP